MMDYNMRCVSTILALLYGEIDYFIYDKYTVFGEIGCSVKNIK